MLKVAQTRRIRRRDIEGDVADASRRTQRGDERREVALRVAILVGADVDPDAGAQAPPRQTPKAGLHGVETSAVQSVAVDDGLVLV